MPFTISKGSPRTSGRALTVDSPLPSRPPPRMPQVSRASSITTNAPPTYHANRAAIGKDRLPPEILSLIFSFTISTTPAFFWGSSDVLGTSCIQAYTPWRIRQVSSSWRTASARCRRLWSRIAIEPPAGSEPVSCTVDCQPREPPATVSDTPGELPWQKVLDKVATLMPKEGPLELGVSGVSPGADKEEIPTLFDSAAGIKFLDKYASRIVNLNIQSVSVLRILRLRKLPFMSFRSLERLSLDMGEYDNNALFSPISDYAETLRQVSVTSSLPTLSSFLLKEEVPWHRFTSVSLLQVFPSGSLGGPALDTKHFLVLARSQNLTQLHLRVAAVNYGSIPPILTLPHLRELALEREMWPLLCITAPSLTHLNLERSPSREDFPEVSRHVIDLITRSDCRLELFHERPGDPCFRGFSIDNHRSVFDQLIEKLSSAKDVMIQGIMFTPIYLESLGSPAQFPNFQSIVITAEAGTFLDLDREGHRGAEASCGRPLTLYIANSFGVMDGSPFTPEQEARVLAIAERAGTSNTLSINVEDEPIVKVAILKAEADIKISRAKIPNPPYLFAQIAHLNRLRVAIAPHKKLPYELWRKVIFSMVDSATPSFFTPSEGFLGTSSVRKYIPWTLRQVCSPWRQLVLDHRRFWNRIVIEPPILVSGERDSDDDSPIVPTRRANDEAKTRALVHRWEKVVEKTANLIPADGPLFIGIQGPWVRLYEPDEGPRKHDSSLLSSHLGIEFLQVYGPRIVNLNIRACEETALERLMSVESTAFSSLESFSIDYGYCRESLIQRNTSIYRASPNLRHLNIRSEGSVIEALLPALIPWNQLTRLELSQKQRSLGFSHGIKPMNILHVLKQAQNLTQLTLRLHIEMDENILPSITLPELESFRLSTSMRLLEWVTLPSLRTLDLFRSHKEEDIFEVVKMVIALIRRSGCTLDVFREVPGDSKFRGYPFNQHRPEFEELLTVLLRNAKEVDTSGIILGEEELKRVEHHELFPLARSIGFRCGVSSEQVLKALGTRLTNMDLSKRLERLRAQSESGASSTKRAKEIKEHYRKEYNVDVSTFYETGSGQDGQ